MGGVREAVPLRVVGGVCGHPSDRVGGRDMDRSRSGSGSGPGSGSGVGQRGGEESKQIEKTSKHTHTHTHTQQKSKVMIVFMLLTKHSTCLIMYSNRCRDFWTPPSVACKLGKSRYQNYKR